jgi:hypothetical protein
VRNLLAAGGPVVLVRPWNFGPELTESVRSDQTPPTEIDVDVGLYDPGVTEVFLGCQCPASKWFIAAQRARLAQVAAAGDVIEKNTTRGESEYEMSLDILEEEGDSSSVEMGGMSDGRTGTDRGKKPIKKRKMKGDDKDDGFVDDEELLWEER